MFTQAFRLALLLALALPCPARAEAPKDFDTAGQFYDQGKFAEAKERYESLVNAGNYSANLFYNLGNTQFRLGDAGDAILNYERALALEPSHSDARANLFFVREKTAAKVEVRTWLDSLFPSISLNTFAIAAAIAAWVAIFCLTAIALKARRERQPLWFAAIASLLVCAYAVGGIWFFEKESALAIVTQKQADARLAPADSSPLADALPAGSRVHILQERGAWIHCELPNGNQAWISTDSVTRVRLRAS